MNAVARVSRRPAWARLGFAPTRESDQAQRDSGTSAHRGSANVRGSLMALAGVALTTAVLLVIDRIFHFTLFNLVSVVYLIPVIVAATRWGLVPALVAAIGGAAAADFFFYPPLYSFWIDDSQNVSDLLAFVLVAIVTSKLAARLQRDADSLRQSEKEIRDLYAFSRRLATCFTVSDLTSATQESISETIGLPVFVLGANEIVEGPETATADAIPQPIRDKATAMAAGRALSSVTIPDPRTGDLWLIRLLSHGADAPVAIVHLGAQSPASAKTVTHRVDALLDEAIVMLDRLDYSAAIGEAQLRFQADSLRDALIGCVSHELRSPLASILGSASVLDQVPIIQGDERVRSLVESMHGQASRLDGDIQNLLSAARMTARGIRPQLELSDPADLVNAAVEQKKVQLAAHRLEVEIAADLPLVRVDSGLIEQAFGQLLENAAKYSPEGSTIAISAQADGQRVALSVSDQGAGLTPAEKLKVGQRSYRGQRHLGVVPGSGLGLWIANTLVAANHGTLDAVSAGPGLGTTVSIRLPAATARHPDLPDVADEIRAGHR